MPEILPGDLVRMRVIGAEENTALVLRELSGLSGESELAGRFTPVPAVENDSDGIFGVVEVVQDFIVGAGVELTGAAVTAAVQTVVSRIRKRAPGKAADDRITVSVKEDGVTEVVVRLQPE
ncbi:MAG: hypothetical protein WBA97_13780 [Actinophytocola sp.]|uniref:hypothetical protein n=1 Tax=Actinophytocola sp. TaxID=1872138 RepID=UPI003C747505